MGATLLGVALCFWPQSFSESFHALKSVERARELLVSGKREDALTMINDLIEGTFDSKANKKLVTEGRKLATFFITESGQKLFELGESMSETNPSLAEEKYKSSLEAEGPNLKILNSLSLLGLREKRCDEAEQWNQKALGVFDKMIEAQAIELQVMACKNNFEGISKKLASLKEDSPLLNFSVVKTLVAKGKIQEGLVKEGLEILRTVSEDEVSYPEAWYWRWKLDPENGQIQRSYLEKYITICKKMTPRLKRVYRESGVVCSNMSEAENALQKSGANGDETVIN